MMVVVTVVLLLFKEKSEALDLLSIPRSGGKLSICRNGMQRIRPVVANRKIIRARREVGDKCRLYSRSTPVAQ